MEELKKLYEATNAGLDIILASVPQAEASVINPKLKFKYRTDERTPSAVLYAPSQKCPYWSIVDYGDADGGRKKSPIDIYMAERGYLKKDFHQALMELCEKYNVREELSQSTNKPVWKESRAAYANEKEGDIVFETRNSDFTYSEVKIFGINVEATHVKELGWEPVVWCGKVKDGMVRECHATESYPIFAQECEYIDEHGCEHKFYKIYKPYEYRKELRFMYSGKVPKDYVYGLNAVKRAYNRNDGQKLPYIALVSGGSDAANALAMGLQPVWLNSETADLSPSIYNKLTQYAEKIIHIPDIDSTGIRMGKKLALEYINMYTLWLPGGIMSCCRDNRGRKRKDLKDYLQLKPSKEEFQLLINQAKHARFWHYVEDSNGKKHPEVSLTGLTYFLEINNFFTLKDEHCKDTRFVHIEGCVVEDVTLKGIVSFLKRWMAEKGVYQNVQDKTLRSRDLLNHIANTLSEVNPDFFTGTGTSQWFYFENCAVEVTKDDTVKRPYSQLFNSGRYVWKHNIIPHPYVPYDQMFNITKDNDGNYSIDILSTASCVFCFLINASRIYWRKEFEGQFADDAEAEAEYKKSHKFCINGDNLTDAEIKEQMQSLVNKIFVYGYMMHRYKVMSRAWSPILYDSRIGESADQCNGRSGKSVYAKWLRHIQKVFALEAKDKKITERQFIFSGVSENTDTVVVDECHKRLDYGFFFGRVTDDFQIERKGIDPFSIPFRHSPKILIATNFVIKETDPSAEARMLPVVFSDYYHQQTKTNGYRETRSVRDDFGFNLFDDAYKGWDADYAFMMQCEQWYLSVIENDEKILPPMNNIEIRQQKVMVGADFEKWADDALAVDSDYLDCEVIYDNLLANYKKESQQYNMSPQVFTTKLKAYCQLAEHIDCYNPTDITGQKADGDRWRKRGAEGKLVQYCYIRSKTMAAEKQNDNQVQAANTLFPISDYTPGSYEDPNSDMAF